MLSFLGNAATPANVVFVPHVSENMFIHLQDVDRLGIGRVMELALEALGVSGKGEGETEAPLHLSFDIDSVDPKV